MARTLSIEGEVLTVFLKPRHTNLALNRMSFGQRLLRMRSRSSGVFRTCAVAGVARPGRIGIAKLVALGVVVRSEAVVSPLGALLWADVAIA